MESYFTTLCGVRYSLLILLTLDDTLAWVSQYSNLNINTCYYMDKMLVIGLLVHILTHYYKFNLHNVTLYVSIALLGQLLNVKIHGKQLTKSSTN